MNLIESRIRQALKRMHEEEANGILVINVPSVRYLSGFTGDSSALLITDHKRLLLTDSRYTEQAEKTAPGFEVIDYQYQKISLYRSVANQTRDIGISRLIFEPHVLSHSSFVELKKACGRKIKLVGLTDLAERLMTIKSVEEIILIKKVQDIADRAFRHVTEQIMPGMTEREISVELAYFMQKNGAQGCFTIVAADANASLPHYPSGDTRIKKDSAILIDWGATYNFYGSDCTRMIYMAEPSTRWKEIHEIVRLAQQAALARLKPGVPASEVDAAARNYIARHGYGNNFGHGLGHGIGMGGGPRLSKNSKDILQPGMICTVEPGIYLPGFGGVRIEDMVLVTKNGYERLTKLPIVKFSQQIKKTIEDLKKQTDKQKEK